MPNWIIAAVVIAAVLLLVLLFSFLFARRKNCKKIFEKYYKESLSLFSGSPFRSSARYELVPMLYVIGDLSLVAQNKDRKKYANQIAPSGVPDIAPNDSKKKFDKRLDFYGKVVRSGYVWGQWSLSEIPQEMRSNPLSRCLIACGDLIMNKDCLKDYENAPLMVYGIDELVRYNQIMYKLSDVVYRYCRAIDKAI